MITKSKPEENFIQTKFFFNPILLIKIIKQLIDVKVL